MDNSVYSEALTHCISQTSHPEGKKYQGKVRDVYDLGDELLIKVTDRLSGFDRQLALIPFKGKVLNQLSAWWFKQTDHIITNHMLSLPDDNSMLVKKCEVFPVEFVVRGFITGSTQTSLWTQYNSGVRNYCGNDLPEGLVKNQKLPQVLITPTTKDAKHDQPISAEEIVKQGLMTQEEWDEASQKVLALYDFGAKLASEKGLILVDTKYELGKDEQGKLILIDEIHTPDSSRYWWQETYQEKFDKGEEPQSFDKEFIRLWFKEHCDPYKDDVLPQAPEPLVIEMAKRYVELYEVLVGERFELDFS